MNTFAVIDSSASDKRFHTFTDADIRAIPLEQTIREIIHDESIFEDPRWEWLNTQKQPYAWELVLKP